MTTTSQQLEFARPCARCARDRSLMGSTPVHNHVVVMYPPSGLAHLLQVPFEFVSVHASNIQVCEVPVSTIETASR